jgi:Coatomer epsilon subunit
MPPPSSDVDEFFDLKNSFYIANYQTTINEALRFKVRKSPAQNSMHEL